MKKIFAGLILTIALLVMVTGTVFAQETTPTPPLTGTVQSIVVETDTTTGVTTVVVSIVDDLNNPRSIRISTDTALTLGLVTVDPTVNYVAVPVDPAAPPTVTFDPTVILEETTAVDETPHPTANALSEYFSDFLGINYDAIWAAHQGDEDTPGVGFGVIAQALWTTMTLKGDPDVAADTDNTALFQFILSAKTSGDYTFPVDSGLEYKGPVPTNWGQFKQAIKSWNGEEVEKVKNNLGIIKSGHADDETTTDTEETLTDTGTESNHPEKGYKDKDKDKDKRKRKDN